MSTNSTPAADFANALLTKYFAERAKYPHLDTICIDYMDGYPTDADLAKVNAILKTTWVLTARQFDATSGRAGCIWVTPKFKIA